MGFLSGLWAWFANQMKQSWASFVHDIKALARAGQAAQASFAKLFEDVFHGIDFLSDWIESELTRIVDHLVWPLIQQVNKRILRNFRILWKRDWRLHERAAAYARQQDRALHRVIEQEAISGYRTGYQGRVGTLTRLLEYAVRRVPLLRDIVDKIISGLLDFAAVDNPILRWLVGFLLNKLLNTLGVDRLAGEFTSHLLQHIIHNNKPVGLHDVVVDMSNRLGTGESQWAQFYTNGGSEVEQAGSQWQDITGPIGDIAIVAFFAAAIVDPVAWARDIQDTAGRAASDVISGTRRLLTG